MVLALLVASGCGRIDFDALSADGGASGDGPVGGDAGADAGIDAVLANHDEDADGIDDAIDPCPHLPDVTADQDGDGVGDLCDPNPAVAGDRWKLFATMRAGDAPFTTGGTWAQDADALSTSGSAYAFIDHVGVLANARLVAGMDVSPVGGGFHQVALGGDDAVMAGYFAEVQDTAGAGVAKISDNAGPTVDQATLASGVHAGLLRLEITYRGGATPEASATMGWASEPYALQGAAPGYPGMVSFRLAENNVMMSVRYIAVITSP